jgi:hypothetical protein
MTAMTKQQPNQEFRQKPKRQIMLKESEVAYLKKEQDKYSTKVQAGIALRINHNTLDRVIRIKSCSEETYRTLFPGKEIS